MNSVKSIKINSGHAIYNFAWAISAHTALVGLLSSAQAFFFDMGRW